MREYGQLIEKNRIEIYAMKQAGNEQNIIAAVQSVHPSTVSRELARNTGLRGYCPKQTQQKALQRRFTAGIGRKRGHKKSCIPANFH
jgi:IS30 family transposase